VCVDLGYAESSLSVLNRGPKQDRFDNCGCQQQYKALQGYISKCGLQQKAGNVSLGWVKFSSRIVSPTRFLQNS